MEFHADLHIHSKYSRACSRDCDLEHLAWWAARKGVDVVGTGDFTHPAWREELRSHLVPAEPGLFRLAPEIERRVLRTLPPACRKAPRFMLSVEISTIYKRGERTRKVHHLLYAPSMEAAEAITADLARIGNLASDGRPILGLDSRDLLEITLSSDPGSYLVPAHVWTPWFAVLGSKSGFDRVEDCYADLADHVFAIETGLSSDPAMNWTVPSLDRYTLVSHSDAHSPPMLAREATRFDTDLDYYAVRRALETREGYRGTVEFFPEHGKYHLDGHRKCGVRLDPEDTRGHGGRCPECGRPLTVGTAHRVSDLAERPTGYRPEGAPPFTNLVPLPEMVSEIVGVGPKSKRVRGEVDRLVAALGSELEILTRSPLDEVRRHGGELLSEAVARLRRDEVIRDAGYDGEYGVIRMFRPEELASPGEAALFDLPDAPAAPAGAKRGAKSGAKDAAPPKSPSRKDSRAGTGPGTDAAAPTGEGPTDEPAPEDGGGTPPEAPQAAAPALFPDGPAAEGPSSRGLLDGLDPEQRAAAEHPDGPLLIVAGPGTGKTRTLTRRIAHKVAERGLAPERCLAITFTRRAAAELRERLEDLLGAHADPLTVTTFHGLGLTVLREQHARAGLTERFGVADAERALEVASEVAGSAGAGQALLARRDAVSVDGDGAQEPDEEVEAYRKRLRERDLVDFADLVALPVRLLSEDPALAEAYRRRWTSVSVDEYQDVDGAQYALLRLLSGPQGDVTAIGDPDQAIYRFRGADVGYFLRFEQDHPGAAAVRLSRNYRSNATIVDAAVAAIAPGSLVPGRELRAVGDFSDPPRIGVHAAADERAEASFVARAIDRLLGGTSLHSLDSGRADGQGEELSFADMCVLYRTSAQAEAVMSAFDAAGVPFQKRTHDRLSARPGVRALAAELPLTPGEEVADRVRTAAGALAERLSADEEAATAARTAGELLLPLARRCGGDLDRFLAELALGAEVDALDPRADRVSLLTLHAAKGLEFPVVFLVGCEDGVLPFRFPGSERDPEAEAEERRLFFVGLTRAQRRLYLSRARRRTRRGSAADSAPSPFLASVPEGLTMPVDEESAARRRPKDRQLRLM
ncbi:UvrD-helicase domain-containing protein [Nocardiopsis sp. RSe5-2]|uniref:DNA 3'-5' helicase n=1 Tax=Nocardiopsis endophytica TaxID=3018445 RepID=A0ABT4U2T1_9ACTN|nr:UvrD-helicase domain-containing protein [Nocardiopsis endophytica]MDA2810814.1 UvrD-helicase domain-containing protein [Nocardiopsis endophytica]